MNVLSTDSNFESISEINRLRKRERTPRVTTPILWCFPPRTFWWAGACVSHSVHTCLCSGLCMNIPQRVDSSCLQALTKNNDSKSRVIMPFFIVLIPIKWSDIIEQQSVDSKQILKSNQTVAQSGSSAFKCSYKGQVNQQPLIHLPSSRLESLKHPGSGFRALITNSTSLNHAVSCRWSLGEVGDFEKQWEQEVLQCVIVWPPSHVPVWQSQEQREVGQGTKDLWQEGGRRSRAVELEFSVRKSFRWKSRIWLHGVSWLFSMELLHPACVPSPPVWEALIHRTWLIPLSLWLRLQCFTGDANSQTARRTH